MNIDRAKIIADMTAFASSAENDMASNLVARVANRLQNQGQPFEKRLTRCELAVIRSFLTPEQREAV